MPAGRPTAYKDEYCEQAEKLSLLGLTDLELAEFFGISEKTFYNWQKAKPKFLQALRAGKEIADANVAKSLYNRALGYSHKDTKFATFEGKITDEREYTKHYPPDTPAATLWLKNRQPDKWRDKQEVEHSGHLTLDRIMGELDGE